MAYGSELIVDVHSCTSSAPFYREGIRDFFNKLCQKLDMEKGDLHFWDYEGEPEEYAKAPPHLKGISAIQFITTSNITIHSLDDLRQVYLNIFSCKDFDVDIILTFIAAWTEGNIVKVVSVVRG